MINSFLNAHYSGSYELFFNDLQLLIKQAKKFDHESKLPLIAIDGYYRASTNGIAAPLHACSLDCTDYWYLVVNLKKAIHRFTEANSNFRERMEAFARFMIELAKEDVRQRASPSSPAVLISA